MQYIIGNSCTDNMSRKPNFLMDNCVGKIILFFVENIQLGKNLIFANDRNMDWDSVVLVASPFNWKFLQVSEK